jgi:tetratricopeptide (TPR) repeat protein
LPSDVEGLYGYLLQRTEELHGETRARGFARLIALSRTGWRESDLRQLLPRVCGEPWDPLRFAALRRSFRAHLAERGGAGQWDFSHAQMRAAVEHRALGDPDLVRQLHRLIADHLEGLPPDDPLGESELMVHLIAGDDTARAARVYADLAIPFGVSSGATTALARHISLGAVDRPNRNVPWIAALLTQPGLTDPQVANLGNRFLFDLGGAIENTADLPARQALITSAQRACGRLAVADASNADWQRALSVSQDSLGDVLQAQGDLAGARKAYGESLAVRQRLAAADPSNAVWQGDLTASFDRLGGVLRDQGDLAGARKAYGESLAVRQRLAAADPGNAGRQRDLSVSQERLGEVLQAQGDFARARKAYGESLAVSQRLAAADPSNAVWQRDLCVSCVRMARACEQAKGQEATHWWRMAFDVLSGMKRRGLFVSAKDEQVLAQLRSKLEEGTGPARAAPLNIEYQAARKRWQAPPWWKRLRTKRPEPPTGF